MMISDDFARLGGRFLADAGGAGIGSGSFI
jgi:hypothetical protein